MTGSTSTPSKTAGAVRAFAWAVASFGLHRFITFVGTLVLARILVPEDFGLIAAAMALMTYFEMALDLGVGSTVVYEQEEGISDRVQTAFTLNVTLGAVIAGSGALAAPLVARFFQAPDETELFRFMFLYLLIKAASQVPDAVLRRDLDFRRRLVPEVSRGAIRMGLAIPLALSGFGAWSIAIGMVVGEVVSTLVTWVMARFRPRLRVDRSALRALLTYGASMLGIRVMSEIANHGDFLIVGNRLGPDELGIYTIAYRVPELILATMFWLYSMVAFPVYSRSNATDPGAVRTAMMRAMGLTTLFAFPAGVGMALVSHDAIHVLFSERWEGAVAPMAVLAVTLAVSSIAVAAGDVLPAIGRPKTLMLINAVLLPPLVAAFVLAAPYGITAVALVQLASTLVFVPVLQRAVNRALGTDLRDVLVAIGPALSAAAGVAAAVVPLLVFLDPGLGRLVLSVLAGVLGAALGVAAGGRRIVPEVRSILRHVGRRSR